MNNKLKEKIGDWLMDVAKYMLTAIALSSAFGHLDQTWMYAVVLVITVLVFIIGVLLIKDIDNKNNRKRKSFNKRR